MFNKTEIILFVWNNFNKSDHKKITNIKNMRMKRIGENICNKTWTSSIAY